MPFKYIITALAILVAALLTVLFLFIASSPSEKPASVTQKPQAIKTEKDFKSAPAHYTSPSQESRPAIRNVSLPATTPANAQPDPATNSPSPEKQAIMDKIYEAMITYSAEGVPILKPLLTSPDLEIREAAIEAMKQLEGPEVSATLREVAKKVTDPRDRKAMLEAADFVDLPAFKPKKKAAGQ